MTNAEARFNNSLRPRKPEGSLGRTAQDVHLDSHTAPELWISYPREAVYIEAQHWTKQHCDVPGMELAEGSAEQDEGRADKKAAPR